LYSLNPADLPVDVLECAASPFPGFEGFLPLMVEDETLHVALAASKPDSCILWAMELLMLMLGRPVRVTLVPDDELAEARRRTMSVIQQLAGTGTVSALPAMPSEPYAPDDLPPLLRLLRMVLLLVERDAASRVLFWPAPDDVKIIVKHSGEGFVHEMVPPPAHLGRRLVGLLRMNTDARGRLSTDVAPTVMNRTLTFHRALYGDAALVHLS
jgi:hypothetical protein